VSITFGQLLDFQEMLRTVLPTCMPVKLSSLGWVTKHAKDADEEIEAEEEEEEEEEAASDGAVRRYSSVPPVAALSRWTQLLFERPGQYAY
jgi:hypothetical protein